MRRILFGALAAGLAATASLSWANEAERIALQESLPFSANGRLQLKNVAGEVLVEAWDREEIALSGELASKDDRLTIHGTRSEMRIAVERAQRRWRYGEGSVLRLKVPRGTQLLAETTSADITVSGLRGKLEARTVSGDLALSTEATEVSAHTVSGDVRLNAARASRTELHTVSGSAVLSGMSGSLHGETVSGDLQIEGGPFDAMELKSVSGNVVVNGAVTPKAVVHAESVSGDVRFNVPAPLDAQVATKCLSCDISLGWSARSEQRKGRERVYTIGNGQAQIRLVSHSGDITLDRVGN